MNEFAVYWMADAKPTQFSKGIITIQCDQKMAGIHPKNAYEFNYHCSRELSHEGPHQQHAGKKSAYALWYSASDQL